MLAAAVVSILTPAGAMAAAPIASTSFAQPTSATAAVLTGVVNPNGKATSYSFQWGPTTSYGSNTPATSVGSGTSDQQVQEAISGLSEGTTYHFRISATNGDGTVFGGDQAFVAGAPTASTGTAEPASATQETLHGIVNPSGQETTFHFELDDDPNFGSSQLVPSEAECMVPDACSAGSDTADHPVEATASGLVANTTYYYRLVARHDADVVGSTATFVAGAAYAQTDPADAVSAASATLNGQLNEGGQPTQYYFEIWGPSDTGYRQAEICTPTLTPEMSEEQCSSPSSGGAPGTSKQPVDPLVLTSLTPGSTYAVRLVAVHFLLDPACSAADSDCDGQLRLVRSYGGTRTFMTTVAPSVGTVSSSSLTNTSASVTGTVNPNGRPTTYHFEYWISGAHTSTAETAAGSGSSAQSVTEQLAALQPNTTYNVQLVATSGADVVQSTVATFTTKAVPGVAMAATSAITNTSATIAGTVDPHGATTSYHFEYGPTTSYGTSVPSPDATTSTASAPTQTLTGLAPNTTYHTRLAATNSDGSSTTPDSTFTTTALPSATTGAASAVGETTATMNGAANAANDPRTTYHFEYGSSAAYGNSTPETTLTASRDAVDHAVSASLSSLQRNQTYHYRLVVTNPSGTANGADQTFLTQHTAPDLTAQPASGVTNHRAVLGGMLNPHGLPTSYHVEYGTTSLYGWSTPESAALSDTAQRAISEAVGGLDAGTVYHFRIVATNGVDPAVQTPDMTFVTTSVPTATTGNATGLTDTGATLNGTVNPEGGATTYHFEYGTSTAYGSSAPASDAAVGSDDADHSVAQALTGLIPNTTYHFRVVATGVSGSAAGADRTFRTTGPPTVSPLQVTGLSDTAATLNAAINPQGQATTYRFEYGTTGAYGSSSPSSDAAVGNDGTDHTVAQSLSGLSPNTTYHYRVVATNAASQVTQGADQTFRTTGPPSAATGDATDIEDTTATLGGSVNPQGQATTYQFEYGRTAKYGSAMPSSPAAAGSDISMHLVSEPVEGLDPNTTYHYRLVARNAANQVVAGSDHTFRTTGPPTAVTGDVSSVTLDSATLRGTVDPNGQATTYRFEYGTTADYGASLPAPDAEVEADAGAHEVTQDLSNLSPGTLYHYRLIAMNPSGRVSAGEDRVFRTVDETISHAPDEQRPASAVAPGATTALVTEVDERTAVLNGIVAPHGTSTTYVFEYGRTMSYGKTASPAADAAPLDDDDDHAVAVTVRGLAPNTTYHYRLVATNTTGQRGIGRDMTFTTLDEPAIDVVMGSEVDLLDAGIVPISIGCPERAKSKCSGTVTLFASLPVSSRERSVRTHNVELGRRTFSVRIGVHRTVRVRLNAAGRSALARHRRLHVRARVRITRGLPHPTIVTKGLLLERRA